MLVIRFAASACASTVQTSNIWSYFDAARPPACHVIRGPEPSEALKDMDSSYLPLHFQTS
jgi:hypothetical protein